MSTRLGYCILFAVIFMSIASASEENNSIKLSSDRYMTDDNGMTLYYSLNDAPGNDISNCIGDCAALWPPFYTDLIRVPSVLSTSNFYTISRTDGKLQTTYKGWPLYLCSKDKEPGDTNGDGEKGIWFVVDPIKFPPAYGGSDGSNTWLFHIRSLLIKFG